MSSKIIQKTLTLYFVIKTLEMGNDCSQICKFASSQIEEYNKREASLMLDDENKEVKIVADRISKNRIQAEFPTPPQHIQQKIQKISKYHKSLINSSTEQTKQNHNKVYRCKSPFNFVYMNLQDRPEQYPIGKCIVYKLKQRDEFVGYFQGTLKQNFVISPQDCLIVFSNGCYFQGISQNQGRYINQNTGFKYEGGWENQMPSNHGKQKNNKGFYDGQYVKGQKQGKGKFTWNDGSSYQGQFQKGTFSGKGILLDQKQNYSYEGDFKSGQKHGKGNQRTKFQSYEGDFMFGLRSGKGILHMFQKGDKNKIQKKYEGEFHQNQPNGKGKLTIYQNGTVKQVVSGFWTKGKITSVQASFQ